MSETRPLDCCCRPPESGADLDRFAGLNASAALHQVKPTGEVRSIDGGANPGEQVEHELLAVEVEGIGRRHVVAELG